MELLSLSLHLNCTRSNDCKRDSATRFCHRSSSILSNLIVEKIISPVNTSGRYCRFNLFNTSRSIIRWGMNLRGVILWGVNLRRVNLRGVNLVCRKILYSITGSPFCRDLNPLELHMTTRRQLLFLLKCLLMSLKI